MARRAGAAAAALVAVLAAGTGCGGSPPASSHPAPDRAASSRPCAEPQRPRARAHRRSHAGAGPAAGGDRRGRRRRGRRRAGRGRRLGARDHAHHGGAPVARTHRRRAARAVPRRGRGDRARRGLRAGRRRRGRRPLGDPAPAAVGRDPSRGQPAGRRLGCRGRDGGRHRVRDRWVHRKQRPSLHRGIPTRSPGPRGGPVATAAALCGRGVGRRVRADRGRDIGHRRPPRGPAVRPRGRHGASPRASSPSRSRTPRRRPSAAGCTSWAAAATRWTPRAPRSSPSTRPAGSRVPGGCPSRSRTPGPRRWAAGSWWSAAATLAATVHDEVRVLEPRP